MVNRNGDYESHNKGIDDHKNGYFKQIQASSVIPNSTNYNLRSNLLSSIPKCLFEHCLHLCISTLSLLRTIAAVLYMSLLRYRLHFYMFSFSPENTVLYFEFKGQPIKFSFIFKFRFIPSLMKYIQNSEMRHVF